MPYRADSPSVGSLIDSYRVGSWFEDDYDNEFEDDDYTETVYCDVCGCDIATETVDRKVYNYEGTKCCKECLKDKLFEEYAEDYEV